MKTRTTALPHISECQWAIQKLIGIKFPVFLFAALSSCLISHAAERNIILIVTDDESPTLGCYGDEAAQTPAIDQLAEESTIFTNAFATTASCSASRSVILTGTYNHANGQYGHVHHYHKFTTFHNVVSLSLPVALSRNGYRTARIGKYHVAPEEVYRFDEVIPVGGSSRNNVKMASQCEGFIKSQSDKPFFLYFATHDPHRSGEVDEACKDELKPDLFGNLPHKGEFDGVEEVFYDPEDVVVPPFLPDSRESRKELTQYYQSIARVDQGVGRLIKILEEANLMDKTMIIFTADHGMAFAGAKTTVYEGGLRVPFVVYNPYGKQEQVYSDVLINHADLAPSILEFAGALDTLRNRPENWIDPHEYWKDKPYAMTENRDGKLAFDRYHGNSWFKALGRQSVDSMDKTHASHTFHEITMYYPMRVVRDRKYKLIWNIAHHQPYPFATDLWASSTWQRQLAQGNNTPYGSWTVDSYQHRPEFELYNIKNDPWETNNLADDPQYSDLLIHYKIDLKAFQEATHDPWILKWTYE